MIRHPLILKYIFRIKPDIVYHIGAHQGQDGPQYRKLGARKICWGEASAESAKIITDKYPSDIVVNKIFWMNAGENITFYESDKPETNSTHAYKSELLNKLNVRSRIGLTTSLDETSNQFGISRKSLLVLDVQGAELEVLHGSIETLKIIENLIIEITLHNSTYEEVSKESELKLFLAKNGFYPSIKRFSHDYSYYDQLFTKRGMLFRQTSEIIDHIFHTLKKLFNSNNLRSPAKSST